MCWCTCMKIVFSPLVTMSSKIPLLYCQSITGLTQDFYRVHLIINFWQLIQYHHRIGFEQEKALWGVSDATLVTFQLAQTSHTLCSITQLPGKQVRTQRDAETNPLTLQSKGWWTDHKATKAPQTKVRKFVLTKTLITSLLAGSFLFTCICFHYGYFLHWFYVKTRGSK